MAEMQTQILQKLDTILQAILDMRVGLTLIVEENLAGIAKTADEAEDK